MSKGHSKDLCLMNLCKQEKENLGNCGQELTESEPIIQVLLRKKAIDLR
jgi:hypothetical protein